MDVGAELGPWVLEEVRADHMRDLSEIFADPNPIHLDPDAARRLGLGDRVVNQGPANWSYILSMLRVALPTAVVEEVEFRLLGPVYAGDRVVAAGRVEHACASPSGQQLDCRVWLDVDGGDRVVEGVATVTVP